MAAIAVPAGIAAASVGSSTIIHVLGLCGLLLGVGSALLAAMPDRSIVIDSTSKIVKITTHRPLRPTGTDKVIPFSAIYSIGVNRVPEEGGDRYLVMLRVVGGRSLALWEVSPPKWPSERDLARFVAADPDLKSLERFTQFRREDRLE
jgi:hypothetical protein